MNQSPMFRAIKQFLRTTTLHGFKYLSSPYYIDRVGWALWCCASACCGGVLCGVVWARFLHTPALLVSRDPSTAAAALTQPVPLVALCVSADRLVHTMAKQLPINKTTRTWLLLVLNQIFLGTPDKHGQLKYLDNFLSAYNLTLPKMLVDYTPPCDELTTKCRWESVMVECKGLFVKEMRQWGACCVMRPTDLKDPRNPRIKRLDINHRLELVLQCSSGSTVFGYKFFTRYRGEDETSPTYLEPGYGYLMHLQFKSVQDSTSERLVRTACEPSPNYSRNRCLIQCKEHICGCSDPLRQITKGERNVPPTCLVSQMNCLKLVDNSACSCPPTCKKINSEVIIESSPITRIDSCIDPMFSGLNATSAIVLDLRVKITRSKIYGRMPTETWLTLLSSLGGVFNMFLGVGLFSALEFIFLIIVRLPIAVRKSNEITPVTEVYNYNHRTFTVRSVKHNFNNNE